MASVKIVTDSTACHSPRQAREHDIRIIPLRIAFGAQSLAEGLDITNEEFYQRLPLAKQPPTTSQPSPSEFQQVYEELSRKGDSILSIHLSGKLSRTVESARSAQKALPDTAIEVVDFDPHSGCYHD